MNSHLDQLLRIVPPADLHSHFNSQNRASDGEQHTEHNFTDFVVGYFVSFLDFLIVHVMS